MKRLKLHLALSLLYLIPPLFRILNALRLGVSLTAPLGSLRELLTAHFVGKSSDTFLYYLPPAYAILKYGEPILNVGGEILRLCYRVPQSYVFLPFMALFGEYFPLYYLLTFSLLFANLLALLLWEFNPGRLRTNLLLALLIFPVVFYYLPFLMLEAPTATFLLAYAFLLARHLRTGSSLYLILAPLPLTLAAFLRPETLVLGLPLIPLLLKRKPLLPSLLPLALPVAVHYTHARACGEQSNFYLWAYALHVERARGRPYSDVADFVRDVGDRLRPCLREKGVPEPSALGMGDDRLNLYLQMFQINNREYSSCFRTLLLSEVGLGDVLTFLKRVPLNFASLLVPSLSESPFFAKVGPLAWPFRVLIGLYGLLLLFALACTYGCGPSYRPLLLAYLLLVLLYALYNPFGGFDALRFKLYVVPFETLFLAFTSSQLRQTTSER